MSDKEIIDHTRHQLIDVAQKLRALTDGRTACELMTQIAVMCAIAELELTQAAAEFLRATADRIEGGPPPQTMH